MHSFFSRPIQTIAYLGSTPNSDDWLVFDPPKRGVVVGVGRSSLSGAEGAAGKMFNFPINIDFFPGSKFKVKGKPKI